MCLYIFLYINKTNWIQQKMNYLFEKTNKQTNKNNDDDKNLKWNTTWKIIFTYGRAVSLSWSPLSPPSLPHPHPILTSFLSSSTFVGWRRDLQDPNSGYQRSAQGIGAHVHDAFEVGQAADQTGHPQHGRWGHHATRAASARYCYTHTHSHTLTHTHTCIHTHTPAGILSRATASVPKCCPYNPYPSPSCLSLFPPLSAPLRPPRTLKSVNFNWLKMAVEPPSFEAVAADWTVDRCCRNVVYNDRCTTGDLHTATISQTIDFHWRASPLSLSPSNKCGHVLYRFTTFTVRPRFVRNSNRLPPYSDRFTLHPLWKNQAQNTTSALRRSHTMRSTSIHPSIHSSTQTLISNFPVLQKKNKTWSGIGAGAHILAGIVPEDAAQRQCDTQMQFDTTARPNKKNKRHAFKIIHFYFDCPTSSSPVNH